MGRRVSCEGSLEGGDSQSQPVCFPYTHMGGTLDGNTVWHRAAFAGRASSKAPLRETRETTRRQLKDAANTHSAPRDQQEGWSVPGNLNRVHQTVLGLLSRVVPRN